MKKRFYLFNAATMFAASFLMGGVSDADLITSSITASAHSSIAANRTAARTVDGTDLEFNGAGVNDPANYTSVGDAGFGIDETWISDNVSPDDDKWIAFDLGGTFSLDTLSVFNLGDQTSNYHTTRGILQADVYYRVGGGIGNNADDNQTAFDNTGWTLLGVAGAQMFNPGPSSDAGSTGSPLGPDQISFGGIDVSAVALDINTTQNGDNRAGINEVQFFTTPSTAVPEPSSLALLGLLAIGTVARRRAR